MCVRFLRSVFDLEQIIGVFNGLNSVTKPDLKSLKINTEDWAGLFLNYITQTSRSVTLWLQSKTGIRHCCEQIDILYNVPAVQTFGAGSVPAMRLRPPTSSWDPPRCLAPCVGRPWRPQAWALHVECIMPGRSAAFVLCVWKALYWSPGEMEGPLIQHRALLRDGAHKHKTYLLRLQSLQRYLICCCP